MYGDATQPAYFLPNYVDQGYCSTQMPPNVSTKKGYYQQKHGKTVTPTKKDRGFIKPFPNQMQLRPQIIQ